MLLRATHLCHSEEQSDVRISRKGILISRFFWTAKDDAKMRRLTKTGAAHVTNCTFDQTNAFYLFVF